MLVVGYTKKESTWIGYSEHSIEKCGENEVTSKMLENWRFGDYIDRLERVGGQVYAREISVTLRKTKPIAYQFRLMGFIGYRIRWDAINRLSD
jgi:hypothetical protein